MGFYGMDGVGAKARAEAIRFSPKALSACELALVGAAADLEGCVHLLSYARPDSHRIRFQCRENKPPEWNLD
jgi:hypothetical protein